MPYETDFQKILKVTRMAKKDASFKFNGATLPEQHAMVFLSRTLIGCMFSGYKARIVDDWYCNVYQMRLGRDVD